MKENMNLSQVKEISEAILSKIMPAFLRGYAIHFNKWDELSQMTEFLHDMIGSKIHAYTGLSFEERTLIHYYVYGNVIDRCTKIFFA